MSKHLLISVAMAVAVCGAQANSKQPAGKATSQASKPAKAETHAKAEPKKLDLTPTPRKQDPFLQKQPAPVKNELPLGAKVTPGGVYIPTNKSGNTGVVLQKAPSGLGGSIGIGRTFP
jgi:hypothetical protein